MASTPDTRADTRTDLPTAYGRAVRGRYNQWQVIVDDCPFCHGTHSHGGCGRGPKPCTGVRVAHCGSGKPQGYRLVLRDGAQ